MDQKDDFSPVYFIFKAVGILLIKAAPPKVFFILCSKVGMVDIYAPA